MVETEVAALIAPWLTPTSLFVLLNMVLVTIFLANNNNKNQSKSKDDSNDDNSDGIHRYQNNERLDYEGASLVPPPPQLVRAPSLFSRVASFNFSNFYSEAQPPPSDETDQTMTVTRAPSLLYRVTSFNFSRNPAPALQKAEEEVVSRDESRNHVMRENQEEKKEEKDKVVKVKKKKVKKEVAAEVKKEEVKKEEVKKEEVKVKETTSSQRLEEEVDSKADDFINRFKQQLKLQRLESLLRYRNDPTPTPA